MNIVVLGDVLLDMDIAGEAQRLSPDAPVPVVDVGAVHRRAGGAGLVARMLARDGHRVNLVTVLSDDPAAGDLRAALAGITVTAGHSGAPTPVKTRVRAAGQAVVRLDEGCAPAPGPGGRSRLPAGPVGRGPAASPRPALDPRITGGTVEVRGRQP